MAPYVEKTLDSICAQTYKNLEIIVVDDGSTDGTKQAIERAKEKDSRIKAIYKENEGVTKTRLRGVQEASGEWIGFVDADDYVLPQMYEKLHALAKEHNADIAHCGYKMVLGERELLHYGTKKLIVQDNERGLCDLIEGDFIEPSLCTKLFKSNIVKELLSSGEMDTSIRNTEDLLMNFYLFRLSEKSVFFDECYYEYLVRAGSATTAWEDEEKLVAPLKVLRQIFEKSRNCVLAHQFAEKRLVAQLIRVSTLKVKKDNDLYAYCIEAKKELNERLPEIRKGNYSKKMKVLSFLAAKCEPLYRLVYRCYVKIKKPNDKYKIAE